MRHLIFAALFFVCGPAFATTVTLQFGPGSAAYTPWQESTMTVVGWEEFLNIGGEYQYVYDGNQPSTFGIAGYSYSAPRIDIVSDDTEIRAEDDGAPFYGSAADQYLGREAYGRSFDLISMDLCARMVYPVSTGCEPFLNQTSLDGVFGSLPLILDYPITGIFGLKSDGSFVTGGWSYVGGQNTVVFDSTWTDLAKVSIRGNSFYDVTYDTFFAGSVEIDNVVLNVVPIPAAAWLYATALLGLGWLRQRPS